MSTETQNLPTDHPDYVAPTTAPTPTPLATPVAAPAVIATPTTPEPVPPSTYSGDSTLEVAFSVFAGQTGVQPERFADAIANALTYGDDKLIDLATLTAGLKPDQAAQAEALAKAAFRETRAQIAAGTQEAYTLAGGQAQWSEATAAFNSHAPDHLKAVVKTMLDNGEIKHAAQFVLDTVRSTGMVTSGTAPIAGGTGSVTQGLSEAEFRVEVGKLMQTVGNRSLEQGASGLALKQLMAARALGRTQRR